MKRTLSRQKLALAAMGAAAWCASAHAATITVPYSDDFTTYTTGTSPANVTIVSPGYSPNSSLATATNSPNYNNGNFSVGLYYQAGSDGTDAAYQTSNISTNTGFTESTAFTLSVANSNATVGLGALGTSSTLVTAAGNSYVFADVEPSNGSVRLYVNESGTQTNTLSTFTGLNTTDTYTETLTGSYTTGGALNLSFTVYDSSTSSSLGTLNYSVSATGAPSGAYFGVRDGGGASSSTTDRVYYQNYSLSTVPEPATLGWLAAAGIFLLRRRKR